MNAGYEILEHTADIGIHAYGPTREAVFEQAALALAEILGASADRAEATHTVEASGADTGAVLVDFLNELLLLHETEEVAFHAVRVTGVGEDRVAAQVDTAHIRGETETTGVKAATYHRLEISEIEDGFGARVYLDV